MWNILEGLLSLILIVLFILTFYISIQNIYYIIISFFGFGNVKKDYESIDDKTRFLILVAAHNEEAVIEDTIKNLKKIDYRKDLYDIYVVNDNSTDSTGDICERIGVNHIDTIEGKFVREGVGKPAGIQYALRALGFRKLVKKYDMLMILDADNYVDSNILKEVNSQWIAKDKPHVIQTYLDSKNTGSILSTGYATAYWMTNRFFQLAKYRVGLPNAIGGTGFAVRLDWLIDNGGFCYKSLTEDLEMEIEIVKAGGRILWNHHTRIYDEKPDDLKISLKQRTRWAQGHWFVAFNNFIPLIKCFFKDKFKFKYIDQLVYLFGMGRGLQLILIIISFIISGIYYAAMNIGGIDVTGGFIYYLNMHLIGIIMPLNIICSLFMFYNLFFIVIYAKLKDSSEISNNFFNMIKVIFAVFYFGITYIITQARGLIKWKQQGVWVKTPHKVVRN